MKFAIFTHVEHIRNKVHYFAYAPYVREMNIWLKHVKQAEVVAPSPDSAGMGSKEKLFGLLNYNHSNLLFEKICSFDLLRPKSVIKAIIYIPSIMVRIIAAMRRADHLHLRCPGNIGLLACICQVFFPSKPKTAKYAGNWDSIAKQPRSYKFQKWILSNTFLTKNMKVLVYGDWPNQSTNILPFFTASFSENEKEKIQKHCNAPYKFLFVGNLVAGKNPQFAIQLVEALKGKNIPVELHLYGNGILKKELEIQTENKDWIHLYGNQPLNVLKEAYKDSHFLILASKSEGWPKAVAEAMFFGCIPIATGVSCVPWMLNYGSRGILIPDLEKRVKRREKKSLKGVERGDGKVESLSVLNRIGVRITELLNDPKEMRRMSGEAQEWSQQYTLEKFEDAIKEVLYLENDRP